ncbi:hypothetical protein OQA88_6327 [Cercophora sp. LCS_1]
MSPPSPAAGAAQPRRSALKGDTDGERTPPLNPTVVKAVQIAEPDAQVATDESQVKKQYPANIAARRLSGRAPTPGSPSRSSPLVHATAVDGTPDSTSGASPSTMSMDAQNHHHRHKVDRMSERLLAQVAEWLEHEKAKKEARKQRKHTVRRKSPSAEKKDKAGHVQVRERSPSIESNSSEASLDRLQRIIEDSVSRLGLSAIPRFGPHLGRKHHRRPSKGIATLSRAASSDTEYFENDVLVPSCDAVLDNSKTLSYAGGKATADDGASISSRREEKEKQAWVVFKNEIIRLAHTLRLKGWRLVPLDSGELISVERLSGALTNAVYVVSPPAESFLLPHEGKKLPKKVLLRIYGPQVEHLIDREVELSVLRRLARKKIGPRLLGIFVNGRFEEYFNSTTLTPANLREPETSKQIAKRMRELHDGVELLKEEKDQGPAVFKNWDKWLNQTEKTVLYLDKQILAGPKGPIRGPADAWKARGFVCGVEWHVFKATVEKYRKYLVDHYGGSRKIRERLVFAHNDTQYGNILRIRPDDEKSPLLQPANEHKQLVVIDFEYAAANVPGLEFANHFSEWTYNYHDTVAPHGCDTSKYPTVEQQRRFIKAYVNHRSPFSNSEASTPGMTPLETPSGSVTPGLHTATSTTSIVDFMLDARAPLGGWKEEELKREAEVEKRVQELMEETKLWRIANSAQWVAWGIIQAKIPGFELSPKKEGDGVTENGSDAPTEEEEVDADAFDYLGYAQERAMFFWGDCVTMGLIKAEELPEETRNKLKVSRSLAHTRTTTSSHSETTLRPSQDDVRPAPLFAGCLESRETSSGLGLSPPTLVPHAPSPPLLPFRLSSTSSEAEIYGPDRLHGAPQVARAFSRPVIVEGPLRRVPDLPMQSPHQPADWEASFNAEMATGFRDDLARLEGVITPGVDDTPYIQYAIEALTRDRDTGYSGDGVSSSDGPTPAPYEHHQFRPMQPQPTTLPGAAPFPSPTPYPYPAPPPQASIPTRAGFNGDGLEPPPSLEPRRDPRASADSLASSLKQGQRMAQAHEWRPVDRAFIVSKVGEAKANGLPSLDFKPAALRAPALFGLMALCLLMVAALILSAVYSELHRGLIPYVSIYGGQYFLFRILPPVLGAIVLLYAQFVITTMLRILPFVGLASDRPEDREGSLFQNLYPKSFLWPQLIGPWQVWVPILATWLMNFTVPLHNSLFTVILKDGEWIWATTQGVAWTLVALYLVLFASTVIVWRYWATLDSTGLIWDPRSLADIAAIVSDTNVADDYHGTQLARSREGIRFALRRRAGDRLGYWAWKDGRPGFWYTLGSPLDNLHTLPLARDQLTGQKMTKNGEKQPPTETNEIDLENASSALQGRARYLPWCLRSNQLTLFIVTTFIFLLAIFIVSFLPTTRIVDGFLPKLDAAPTPSAFSAANFLYSFLPSLLGMVLFLLFQSLDLSLRILQPWASLADPRGATTQQSLLADYAACAPLQAPLHALRNGHHRVAAISLLSTLFAFIPTLAGASFMALTPASGVVRMYPNVPTYGVTLALLMVYLLVLVALLPGRGNMRMPHAVTCLAEVVGYVVNEEMVGDLAFKQCRERGEMLGKLGVGSPIDKEAGARWGLMVQREAGEDVLGVRRVRRFTEKRVVRKSQIRRRVLV